MPEIVSVIEFQGPVDSIVWKSPVQNFNSASQLIVDEGHWAILLLEGRAELFGPGRHTLDTSNYPGLRSIQAFATGGRTMFPCQVYFVKQVHSMDLQWGSKEALTVNDPQLDIIMHLRVKGSLTYAIDNPLKFVEKFCGFTSSFSPDDTVRKFRGIISTEVSDCITKIVNVARVGYLDINAHLKEISQILQEQMTPYFDDYGIKLVYFMVETITSREDDLSEVASAKSAARARVIDATGQAQAREIQGYDWMSERRADILQALASNQGSMGGMLGMVGGVMTGGAFGSSLSGVVDDIFPSASAGGPLPQPSMGQGVPQPFGFTSSAQPTPVTPTVAVEAPTHVDVRDVLGGGAAPQVPTAPTMPQAPAAPQPGMAPQPAAAPQAAAAPLSFEELTQKLQQLQQLVTMGLITQDDFEAKKRDLLARL